MAAPRQEEGPAGFRLADPRQAGRHGLDRGRLQGQMAVPGREGRPCRHARPAGLRHAADRARRGDQDRALCHGRRQGLSLHRRLGRGALDRRPRRPGDARPPTCGPTKPRSARCCRNIPASSCRRRRNSRRSRSPASAPTISPATARRSTFPPREVEIGRFDLIEQRRRRHAVFEIECGKGTYVRSLARDMGRDLGCFGHIAELRRIEVEPFTADDLVTLDELEAASPRAKPDAEGEDRCRARPLRGDRRAPGRHRRRARMPAAGRRHRRRGGTHPARQSGHHARPRRAGRGRRGLRDRARQLVAIGAIEAGMFKPKRVFAG